MLYPSNDNFIVPAFGDVNRKSLVISKFNINGYTCRMMVLRNNLQCLLMVYDMTTGNPVVPRYKPQLCWSVYFLSSHNVGIGNQKFIATGTKSIY